MSHYLPPCPGTEHCGKYHNPDSDGKMDITQTEIETFNQSVEISDRCPSPSHEKGVKKDYSHFSEKITWSLRLSSGNFFSEIKAHFRHNNYRKECRTKPSLVHNVWACVIADDKMANISLDVHNCIHSLLKISQNIVYNLHLNTLSSP